MSKNTNVKAATQGGDAGSGGGPPGTWEIVGSGTVTVSAGVSDDFASLPYPTTPKENYLVIMTMVGKGAGGIALAQGNVLSAPPNLGIVYGEVTDLASLLFRVRPGAGIGGGIDINWVIYKVTLP